MPGRDKTGPEGQGSGTGRGLGGCVPEKNATDKGKEGNQGDRKGRGRGRGNRHWQGWVRGQGRRPRE